jgi:GNAT superfamily N-acetyltransferase
MIPIKLKDISIDLANIDDLNEILILYSSSDMDNGNTLSAEKAKGIFVKMSNYPDYKVYVAKLKDRIIGTFALLIMDNMIHQGRSSGLVESVVVHEEFRSVGIGKLMMEFAMQKCRESNCYKMALSSNLKREKAHSFYEKLGFKKHGYSFLVEI